MKVFIWFPQGRLGNLIFQYQAIRELSGSAKVVAMDSEFFDLFERPGRILVLPCFKRFRWRLLAIWTGVFAWLARWRWIGTVQPGRHTVIDDFTWETEELFWIKGKLENIFMIKGYFQTPRYVNPLPRLKMEVVQEAERRLATVPKFARVAIHMRFGDFRNWSVFGVPGAACLPDSYYLMALEKVDKSVPDAHFVVLSDEPAKARAILVSAGAARRMTVMEGGTAQSDFALIAACSHAVVSASTFSWWAATLIENPDRMLVAPKYWAGFKRKTWYPSSIESKHFHYIEPVME